jgi:hypothetical protein
MDVAPESPDGEVVPEAGDHDKDGPYEGLGDLGNGHGVHASPSLVLARQRHYTLSTYTLTMKPLR